MGKTPAIIINVLEDNSKPDDAANNAAIFADDVAADNTVTASSLEGSIYAAMSVQKLWSCTSESASVLTVSE